MSWRETDEREYRAPLDAHEKFMVNIAAPGLAFDREHWAISAIVSFHASFAPSQPESIHETVALMGAAWKRLRFEFPAIAASRDAVTLEKIYRRVDERSGELQEWLKETLVVVDPSSSVPHTFNAQAAEPYEVVANSKPHPYPTLYYFPDSSKILFHASHWRIDGIGTLMLLNRFFELLTLPGLTRTTLPWSSEVSNLRPSIETALNVPLEASESSQSLVQSRLADFLQSSPSTGLPYKGDAATLPAGTRRTGLTFTQDSTRSFVGACKARGLTPAVAVHAACIHAMFALEPESQKQYNYVGLVPQNLRPFLPSPLNGPTHAAGDYMTGHTVSAARGLSFADTAASVARQYRENFTTPELVAAMRVYGNMWAEVVQSPPPKEWPPPSDLGMSSLGVLEKHFGGSYGNGDSKVKIEVDDVDIGVEMLTRQIEVYVWTWREKMRIRACYNEAYYDKNFVGMVLQKVREILLEGMGESLDLV